MSADNGRESEQKPRGGDFPAKGGEDASRFILRALSWAVALVLVLAVMRYGVIDDLPQPSAAEWSGR